MKETKNYHIAELGKHSTRRDYSKVSGSLELPNLVEGLIRVDSLQGDFYTFDAEAFTLRGKKDKRGFRLGDTVKVKVINANKQTKTVDFELIERIN